MAILSQPLHIPFSNVQSYVPNGDVVPVVVIVVVVVVNVAGSASVGMITHGFSNIRRSSIAISPSCDSPKQINQKLNQKLLFLYYQQLLQYVNDSMNLNEQ